MALHLDGQVGCVEESLSTASSLVTQTTGTVTSTRTLTSTVTVRATSFLTTSSTASESGLTPASRPLTTPTPTTTTIPGSGSQQYPTEKDVMPVKATNNGPFVNTATKNYVPLSTQTVTFATALTLIGAYCSC